MAHNKEYGLKEFKKEQKQKKINKRNRLKALAFIVPVLGIILLVYFWIFWNINNGFDNVGLGWEVKLIIIIMAFIIFKNQIFRPIIKKSVEITKNISKGKSLREQIDENIPLETENY